MKKFFIGVDHAGIVLKDFVINYLVDLGYEVEDLGCFDDSRVDFPIYAKKVASAVSQNPDSNGVLICGTGIGMSIAANKITNIRAALCHNEPSARLARQHNDANVLCMGARISGEAMVESILSSWLRYEFEGGRHTNRVKLMDEMC